MKLCLAAIQKFVDEEINPALEDHGGYLTIEEYDEEEKCLYVTLGGGCQGCSMSRQTLHVQIRRFLMEEFPDLGDIQDLTDHTAGKNPYYGDEDET
tara:strand:- start:586 stop:873 length:288 start_codon:yes stop_codon:yes gene_type:complete